MSAGLFLYRIACPHRHFTLPDSKAAKNEKILESMLDSRFSLCYFTFTWNFNF